MTGPADRDELRNRLARHRLTTPIQCTCGWRETDPDSGMWDEHVADALLPVIREHTAAVADERARIERLTAPRDAVAAERGRLDQLATWLHEQSAREDADDCWTDAMADVHHQVQALISAREEHADG